MLRPAVACLAVKTRTLLLLAVTCGLAILIAGTLQLLRLSGEDTPAPTRLGVEARAGDVRATLLAVDATPATLTVRVRLRGVDDPAGLDGFTMVYAGAGRKPTGGTCRGLTVAPQECTLVFDNAAINGTSRLLLLRRAGDQVRWVLVSDAGRVGALPLP